MGGFLLFCFSRAALTAYHSRNTDRPISEDPMRREKKMLSTHALIARREIFFVSCSDAAAIKI